MCEINFCHALQRELIQQELEEERVLREEAEARVRDLIEENESSRGRLQALHTQLSQLGRKSNQLISSLHKPTLNKVNILPETRAKFPKWKRNLCVNICKTGVVVPRPIFHMRENMISQ